MSLRMIVNGKPYVRWGLWIFTDPGTFDFVLGIHLNGKPYFRVEL